MRAFYVALMLLLTIPGVAKAADAPAATPAAAEAPTQAPAQDPSDLDERTALAKKMHDINPARDQINGAIDDVAQSQPEAERETFKTAMRSILNYQAIEKISIDAMAETYTKAELEAMVEYYSKPEAKSAAKKDDLYNQKVYPEIGRMLDQAMMRIRTGSGQ